MSIRAKVKPSWVLAVSITLLMQMPVSAKILKTIAGQKVWKFSETISSDRGGSKERPLGVYLTGKTIEFKSGYKDVDPKVKAEWASALGSFIEKSGGGITNYRKYQMEGDPRTNEQYRADNYANVKSPHDPQLRAHVPYTKQAAFAEKWWTENSPQYKSTVLPPKEWWINDAVLDGNNLYTLYQQANGEGSGEFGPWRTEELRLLIDKK